MSDDLVINASITLPAADLAWQAVRSSGPGGQNVNKVATKVLLFFDLAHSTAIPAAAKARLRRIAGPARLDQHGTLRIASDKTRSQTRNLADARERLRQLVLSALIVPKVRKATKPSKAAKRRRLEAKRRLSDKKQRRRKPNWED